MRPILYRIADKRIGRDGVHRVVKALDLYRCQGDLHNVPVDILTRHSDPVAHMDHITTGQLYTGHESEDGVLKDQHKHCRQGCQAPEYCAHIDAEEQRYHNEYS